jgi:hypothetical protein
MVNKKNRTVPSLVYLAIIWKREALTKVPQCIKNAKKIKAP